MMKVIVLLLVLLTHSVASADWLRVPVIGDGQSVQTRLQPDLPTTIESWSGKLIRDGSGNPSHYIVFVNTDTSARTLRPGSTRLSRAEAEAVIGDVRHIEKNPYPSTRQSLLNAARRIVSWFGAAVAWAADFADNFTRSNENPMVTDWTTGYGAGLENTAIVSNAVEPSGINGEGLAHYDAASVGADQYSQVTVSTLTGTNAYIAFGVILRGLETTPTYYFLGGTKNNAGGQTSFIYSNVAGSYVTHASETATTWAATDVVRGEIVGDNLTLKRNGNTLLASDGDTLIASGQPGLLVQLSHVSDAIVVDDWTGGDLATTRQRVIIIQ